jgi:hypothetical protein
VTAHGVPIHVADLEPARGEAVAVTPMHIKLTWQLDRSYGIMQWC